MNETGLERKTAPIRLPTPVHALADQNVASVIEVLQEQLTPARQGKLRWIAIASYRLTVGRPQLSGRVHRVILSRRLASSHSLFMI